MAKTPFLKRRDFLKTLGRGAALTTAALLTHSRPARAGLTANEKIVVGLIGCGGMGNAHLDTLLREHGVEVAAVCDVHVPRYEAAKKKVGGACEGYQDFRRVLDRKDIDAVFSATPDHWHALTTIMGCQAWKDVYVEKPLTTTVYEGRKVVETARRYGRIVQCGLQQRSMDVYRRAMDIVHGGKLGEIVTARAWIGPNGSPPTETPMDPPKDLDWDMWLGPAPWVPYSPQRLNFRAFKDYAGGELTNWGPHLLDIVLWGLQQNAPLSVTGHAGSYRSIPMGGDQETLEVIYEFKGCTVTWSQAFNEQHFKKGYGTMFQGTSGVLAIDRPSFVVEPASLGIPEYKQKGESWIRIAEHHKNFFDCMRTRELPRSDCEIAHRTTSMCLLGNIAVDLRRKLVWDGQAERFIGDDQANRSLFRPYRSPWHL